MAGSADGQHPNQPWEHWNEARKIGRLFPRPKLLAVRTALWDLLKEQLLIALDSFQWFQQISRLIKRYISHPVFHEKKRYKTFPMLELLLHKWPIGLLRWCSRLSRWKAPAAFHVLGFCWALPGPLRSSWHLDKSTRFKPISQKLQQVQTTCKSQTKNNEQRKMNGLVVSFLVNSWQWLDPGYWRPVVPGKIRTNWPQSRWW